MFLLPIASIDIKIIFFGQSFLFLIKSAGPKNRLFLKSKDKIISLKNAVDSALAEVHYNEAIALDKLGQHGEATKHFKIAQENANGNKAILESKILLSHVQ